MKVVIAAVPLINTRVPPLSLASIKAYLENEGHTVKAFDFNIETYHAVSDDLKTYWTYYKGFQWGDTSHFQSYIYPNIIGKHVDAWADRILFEQPEVIGISVTGSEAGKILCEVLKRKSPRAKIVIGGPSCSKTYDDPEKVPGEFYDAVVHNEGEASFAALIRSLAEKGEFEAVPGTSILDRSGRIVFGGQREAQMALDLFPTPNFDDFDFALYVDADDPTIDRREIPYFTSRGCPARCNFCMDYKMWDLRFRQKSPARIVQEMEELSARYGIKKFMLIELIFNGHMAKMRELVQILKERNNGFSFWGHGRIDSRLDRETIQNLKDAGFFWFIFGLESASDKVLKSMRKGYTVEVADRVLADMREVGLMCSVNIVVGFPGEDWQDYLETIQFVHRHRFAISTQPSLASCQATPGSDLYLYPEKFGIRVLPGGNCDVVRWETTDGLNTFLVREFRKEFMHHVFAEMQFSWKKNKTESKFDILGMPNPFQLFRQTEGKFSVEAYENWPLTELLKLKDAPA